MMLRRMVIVALAGLLDIACCAAAQARPLLVLAASSLQESLTAASQAWAAQGHERPVLSFAGSPALARQVEAGAPADLFISADEAWMDELQSKGLVRKGTRASFLANRLVLVAPAGSPLNISIQRGFPLARALGKGRLAMADPDSVPAGRYGRAALASLGVWPSVRPKIVRAENVRAALAFVERGAAAAGIVYDTDRRASPKTRLVGVFPQGSHPPITYSIATLGTARNADADGFRRFLLSLAAKRIFTRFGFSTL